MLFRRGNPRGRLGRWHERRPEGTRLDEQGQQCYDPEQDIGLVWGVRHGDLLKIKQPGVPRQAPQAFLYSTHCMESQRWKDSAEARD